MKSTKTAALFHWLFVLLAVVLSSATASAAPTGYQVVLKLSKQPPSRVYCELQREGSNEVVQVEFDPTASSRITRAVTLATAKWTLTCSVEAKQQLISLKDSVTAPVDVAWSFPLEAKDTLDLTKGTSATATITGQANEIQYSAEKLVQKPVDVTVSAAASNLPSLASAKNALSTREGGAFGGRSLDATAPPLVQDTLQILAEIALERARTRGYALVSQRITALVCDDLKADVAVDELGIEPGERLLPNTCEAVRNMNLHEIAQSGPAISAAVQKDVVAIASRATLHQVLKTVQLVPDQKLVDALLHAVNPAELAKGGHISPETTHRVLEILRMNFSSWGIVTENRGNLDTCAVSTALLVAERCLVDSKCNSADDLGDVFDDILPQSLFGKDQACSPILTPQLDWAKRIALTAYENAKQVQASTSIPDLIARTLAATADIVVALDPKSPLHAAVPILEHVPFIVDSLGTILKPVLLNHLPTTREMQLVLIRLAQHQWARAGSASLAECSVELAFAAMAECHGREGGCDARAISDLLQHPAEHFDLGACNAALNGVGLEGLQWPQIAEFVANGVDIVAPPPGATTRDQMRDGVRLVFSIAHRFTDDSANARTRDTVAHLETLSLGIADQDTRTALVESVAIARIVLDEPNATGTPKKLLKVVERLTPIIATLTANAKSLKEAAANPDQAEALRKARKESLEALIDASTDRSARGGETVISLGANVGFYAGSTVHGDSIKTLALPMGLAVQSLPLAKGQTSTRCSAIPGHFQVSVIDLGQFVSQDQHDLRWNDFLLIGAQIGWIPNFFNSPSDAFVFGPDLRFVPGGSRKGEFFFGAFASYYVPFFDLN